MNKQQKPRTEYGLAYTSAMMCNIIHICSSVQARKP